MVLPDPNVGCQPAAVPFWLGAAAIVLIFSFFGFFDSRLPFCSRLAMTFSLVRWPGFTVGAIASTSVEGLIVFLTAMITVAIFFGCFALSDILLSDPQKKWIEDRILRLWLWLAEAKQYSILDWLRQYYRWIVGIAVLLVSSYVSWIVWSAIFVEPIVQIGTAGVMGERGRAEQQEDQDNPHHHRGPTPFSQRLHSRGSGTIFRIDVDRIRART